MAPPAADHPRDAPGPPPASPAPQERNLKHPDGGPEASRITATARRKLGTLGSLLDGLRASLESPACVHLCVGGEGVPCAGQPGVLCSAWLLLLLRLLDCSRPLTRRTQPPPSPHTQRIHTPHSTPRPGSSPS